MSLVINTLGREPNEQGDSTRAWTEIVGRQGKPLKPNLVLRWATDTNYILNRLMHIPVYDSPGLGPKYSKAVMNAALPGMRVPGVLNWNVTETSDQLVQTASFEAYNCLPISEKETTLTSTLAADIHSPNLVNSYAGDSLFVVQPVSKYNGGNGNVIVNTVADAYGIAFQENKVRYRLFAGQTFTVNDAAGWPDPRIPNDEDNDVGDTYGLSYWADPSANSVGNYFVQIDQEVIRVSLLGSNTFTIVPGGRAINGVLQQHNPGAKVQLLGFSPTSGDWTGMGYLAMDDFKPQRALLRPGTCLVSYEGYGKFPTGLSHNFNEIANYAFTGYWFVTGVESDYGEDGIPKVKIDLKNAGQMLDEQKITPDLVQRIRNQFGQWGKTDSSGSRLAIFGDAGHNRDIPGDWVDYNAWNPSLQGSYPLSIKTEFAQHKAFYDHMKDTQKGLKCLICRQERANWVRTHTTNTPAQQLAADRQVGKHIYGESIRVMMIPGGPLFTYVRLMAVMAMAAWDHPAYGTELSQRFTKIPSKLFDNMVNLNTQMVYNGQLDMQMIESDMDKTYDWAHPDYDDHQIISRRKKLTCPFDSTYDKAPFSQPMVDLADVNGNKIWITRKGHIAFLPTGMPFRPHGERNEWFLMHGASISTYSHQVAIDQIITQCWVTAKTAFDSEFTVVAGGTGLKEDGGTVVYSGVAGNKEGLVLTSGSQQVDTQSVDNLSLGLDWDTSPANYGAVQSFQGDMKVMNAKPALYQAEVMLYEGIHGYATAITRVQQTINFFLIRHYIAPLQSSGKYYWTIAEDGKFGPITKAGVIAIQNFLLNPTNLPVIDRPTAAISADGHYNRNTYKWIAKYFDVAGYFIKTDIWYYVINDRDWNEYVAAVTGVPVILKQQPAAKSWTNVTSQQGLTSGLPKWIPDDEGTQKEVMKWQAAYYESIVNIGNRKVDDAVNKATVRSISTNLADPRILPGDTIWCEVPGFLGARNALGRMNPPYTNGIYVTSISRQMDLTAGTYTATYSGYRARGSCGLDPYSRDAVNPRYDFIG